MNGTGGYAITASGVDVVDENKLTLGKEKLETYNDGSQKNTQDFGDPNNNRNISPKMLE